MGEQTPLTADQLDEIQQRAGAATPGPWAVGHPTISPHVVSTPDGSVLAVLGGCDSDWANAAFIAAARTDVPRLLADNARLRDELRHADARIARLEAEADRLAADRGRWQTRYYEESRTYWDAELPPGGECCADCGQPVESEPCAEHHPATVAERLRAELAKYVGAEPTIAEEMAYMGRCLDAVLDLCDRVERGASRWEQPLPVPEWVEQVRAAATGENGGHDVAELRRQVADLTHERNEARDRCGEQQEQLAALRPAHRPLRDPGLETLRQSLQRAHDRETDGGAS